MEGRGLNRDCDASKRGKRKKKKILNKKGRLQKNRYSLLVFYSHIAKLEILQMRADIFP